MASGVAIHEAEIEARVCQVVDALLHPAGEFTPRVRTILTELVDAVERRNEQFGEEPTQPKMRLAIPPPAPPVPRAPQKTMEIPLSELIWDEETRQ